jgi:hypothetical protein
MTTNGHRIDRRAFHRFAGAAALLSLEPRSTYGWAGDAAFDDQRDGRVRIPFHEPTDVLICGSTLFACDLAMRVAATGRRTTLVMERVNPLFEGITCLRSWVDEAAAAEVPAFLAGMLANDAITERRAGRIYFNPFKASVVVEDALADAKVRFLYNAAVAGALGDEDRIAGVVFGGKTGLFGIEAGAVVDATPAATVARCAGFQSAPAAGPRSVRLVAELVTPVEQRTATYTATNGVEVRASLDYYFVDFEMTFSSDHSGPLGFAADYARAYAASLECPLAWGEKRLRGADGYLHSGIDRLAVAGKPRFANLHVLGPETIPGNTRGSLALADPLALFKAFPDAAERVAKSVQPLAAARPAYDLWNKAIEAQPDPTLLQGVRDHGFDEPGSSLGEIRLVPPVPIIRATAVVAGGGASGNAASYASGELGTDTVCLERGPEMGGTNTLGGVNNLWYGNKTKAFEQYYATMKATNRGLNAPGFFKGVSTAGAKVLFHSVVTGVARTGRSVSRVYLATPLGLAAVAADYVIDASGDGCIAAWAGNGYRFGGDHDEMTMVASFAGFRPNGGDAIFTYHLPCDERSAFDATRFIVAMRRNGRLSLDRKHFPPPFYIAPRESRHITGGKTLTYLDVLAGRRFTDAVLRFESIPDIKGLATSDASVAGLVPADWKLLLQASLPYSALLPTALDNVIVIGKAYSVAHDALCMARMQRDMAAMGMVAAEAVRLAARGRLPLRDVPIAELQGILVTKRIMPADAVAADDLGFTLSAAKAAAEVAGARNADVALIPSAVLALLPREEAVAALGAYANSDNPAVRRIQAFLEMPCGLDHHVQLVGRALAEPSLPTKLSGGNGGGTGVMPEQGWAPIPAVMLGCLAVSREPRAVPLLVALGNSFDAEESQLDVAWGYFYSLAFGFERLAGPEGREPLRRLLGLQVLQDRIVHRHDDPRSFTNLIGARYAYLRMALARALLRCGDPRGAETLVDFLDESRIWIARAARAALVTATGEDLGFDADAWKGWLAQHANRITVQPQERRPLHEPSRSQS